MFWVITEWCLTVLVLVFVITQLLYPAITNKPLFWWWRKGGRDLLKAEDALRNDNLEREIRVVHRLRVEGGIQDAKGDMDVLKAFKQAQDEIQYAKDELQQAKDTIKKTRLISKKGVKVRQ